MTNSVRVGKKLLVARLTSHVRTPLFRNGYALMLSAATMAGLGMLYWVLAARSYTADAVGLNAATLSAMMFLSGVSQRSLNGALVRFVPVAGRATKRLVGSTYLISLIVAAVVSLIFGLGLSFLFPTLRFLGARPVWLVSFVLATMMWCIFTLQSSVLAGLREAVWVPIANTTVAVVKIALLILLAKSFPEYGIFASWMIPVVVSLVPVNLLVFRRLMPKHVQATAEQALPLNPREILKYVAGTHLGSLLFLASTTLLPVIVTVQAGARANAHFYQPWMIASSLQLVATNMTISLIVEATKDQEKMSTYGRRVLVHITRLLVPVIVVILVGAPIILRVFGSDYATEGTNLLRLLALSAFPNVIVVVHIGLARVQNRVGRIVTVQGALCVLVLSMSCILLRVFGITGVGLAWLASQTAVAAFLILTQATTGIKCT